MLTEAAKAVTDCKGKTKEDVSQRGVPRKRG